ncbi:NADPh quinone reductase [Podila minutissima]|nr:NADPh quinone reductase [Podila minutissima]
MATYAPDLPQSMKAVHWTKVGNPAHILTLDENLPLPVPTGTNVLVKMHASSINPLDWKLMKGAFPRFLMPKVKTPGLDISGVVVGLGPNVGKSRKASVQTFTIGDRVMAMLDLSKPGALQDYTLVDESLLIKTPDEWTDPQAAAFPLVGTTVYQALVVSAKVKKGDKVLINGASGGTGTVAVQIATALGASVVGVCSKTNADLVRRLGAEEVVDYNTTKVHEKYTNKDFDIIFDAVSNPECYANSGKLLKSTGHYIQITGPEDSMYSLVGGLHLGAQIVGRVLYSFLTRGPRFHLVSVSPNGEHLAAATHIMVRANAKTTIELTYSFDLRGVLGAVALSQSGHAKGKIGIIVPGHES